MKKETQKHPKIRKRNKNRKVINGNINTETPEGKKGREVEKEKEQMKGDLEEGRYITYKKNAWKRETRKWRLK